jgi:hypothetical protein
LLGNRGEVSAELIAAQMQGYRNEVKRRGAAASAVFVSPRVREPPTGFKNETNLSREVYLKRQAAGGGILVGNIASQERNLAETINFLFTFVDDSPSDDVEMEP